MKTTKAQRQLDTSGAILETLNALHNRVPNRFIERHHSSEISQWDYVPQTWDCTGNAFQKQNCLHGFTSKRVKENCSPSNMWKKTRLKMAAHKLLAKQSIKQSTLFNAQLLWNFFTLFSTQRFCKESIASSCCHSWPLADIHMKLSNVQASTAPTWGMHIELPIILRAFAGCPSQSWSKLSGTKLETKGWTPCALNSSPGRKNLFSFMLYSLLFRMIVGKTVWAEPNGGACAKSTLMSQSKEMGCFDCSISTYCCSRCLSPKSITARQR